MTGLGPATGRVLVCCLVLTACSGPGEDDAAVTSTPALVLETDGATAAPDPSAAPEDAAVTTGPVALPEVDLAETVTDPELRGALRWVLGLLEPGAEGPAADEAVRRFAPDFLEEVPVTRLGGVLAQLRSGGPWAVTDARQGEGTARSATLVLDASEQPMVMTMALDAEHRIASLSFQPDTSGEEPELTGWADLDAALDGLGGQSQVVVGRVDGGACELVHTTGGLEPGGEAAPSASVVKLLVLSAVAAQVQDGELGWDQELTVTDELRSLPSGVLQDRPEGSRVTVREAAELMISISDNTATDLLIEAVGQRALRSAADAAGLDTVRVMPVPSTRQLFQLGWQVDPEVRTRWAEAQVPETREAILADLPEELELDAGAVSAPRWQDDVDWLLTGGEICSLHARLQQQARDEAAAPVRDILAVNPGVTTGEPAAHQAFKGGSAPGVLALSFYVEDEAGRGQVLVVQTRSPEPVDELRAVTLARAALRHLGASAD
ncbi:serine hydrolase [Serinicoccus sp. LYQ131]|uniref:serine hydrolase n=1 Tax=Serinicoccus sp. LYQ131 TaxID=3378797 RepID=UPI003854FE38